MMGNKETKTVAIFCRELGMGGTETLIVRLLAWYKQKNCRVILLTILPITNKAIIEDTSGIEFEHYIYDQSKKDFLSNKVSLTFESNDNPLVLTQYFPEFFKCYTLLKESKYGCRFTHIIYIVHPYSTYLNTKMIISIGKVMVNILLKTKSIVFMDEECVNTCVAYYKLDANKYEFAISRLPIFVSNEVNNQVIKKSKPFNILSISRFDFPFKGYILGLLKSFSVIYHTNKDISLTIIGYGKDKYEIDALVNKFEPEIQSAILILDQVPYNKINQYICKCDVLVGMGTTILDAANQSKIGIVAVAYQRDNLSTGFFHENYKTIGELLNEKSNYQTFDELLLTVLNASENEFYDMSVKSKGILEKYYNIDIIASEFLSHTDSHFSHTEKIIVNLVCHLNNIALWLAKYLRR